MKNNKKSLLAFYLTVIFILLVTWIGTLTGNSRFLFIKWSPECRWIAIMVLMVLFLALIGWVINGRFRGVLIDSRNKMSLSRFQVTMWTIVIMSAFVTMGLARARKGGIEKLTPDNIKGYKKLVKPVKLDCIDKNPDNDEKIIENCTNPQALDIYFPEELLLAMGISLASFAGASLIKSNKRTYEISKKEDIKTLIEEKDKELTKAKNALEEAKQKIKPVPPEWEQKVENAEAKLEEAQKKGDTAIIEKANVEYIKAKADLDNTRADNEKCKEEISKGSEGVKKLTAELAELRAREQSRKDREGILHKNNEPKDASWDDIFRGEEVINFQTVDMAKVQMFFITITIIFTYAVSLFHLFQGTNILNNPFGILLPGLSSNVIALLGISHGGYLAVKAPSNTKTVK